MDEKGIHQENHKKNDFLIERIAFFSDAVFAIAITLMIIDIHPPVVQNGDTSAIVWNKLLKETPEFAGLVVSFWLIGSAWLRHHQLFKYMASYDMGFLILNLFLLFTIILFPFSTSFLFKSLFENIVTKPQVIFYLGVPLFSNIILYFMFRLVKKRHLGNNTDRAFHKSIFDQAMMIIAFLITLTWVLLVPVQYHFYGYIFLGIGPLASSFKKMPKYKSH